MPRVQQLQRAIAFASFLVLVAAPAFASGGRIARIGAQLRAETGFAGPVTASPAEGAPVEILERRVEWVRVRVAEGKEGWIHELFVAEQIPSIPEVSAALSEPRSEPEPAAAVAAAPTAAPAPMPNCDEWGRRALQAEANLRQRSLEADYSQAKLAEMNRSVDTLAERLQELSDERDAARAAVEAASAALDAARAEGFERGKAETAAAAGGAKGQSAAIAAALATQKAEFDAERAAIAARHADELAASDARHQEAVEGFIAMVTQRHDEALARASAAIQADFERRLIEANRKNEKELRTARKESGYEADLEREVRARLDTEIEDAKARWEAKQRGEMYDVERARREEGERVRKEVEGERLIAVGAAISAGQAELRAAVAAEREEADLRCQVALSLVLERAAEGGDMKKVKDLAEKTARRRSADAGPAEPGSSGGMSTEPPGDPARPAEPPSPIPQPMPFPVKPNPGGAPR